jgi:hypothetical protein
VGGIAAEDGKPLWDSDRAESLLGKYVLVGITYLDPSGDLVRKSQMHGTIVAASESEGVGIELKGTRLGEMFCLPPDLRAFQPAPPGDYSLKSTKEIITDPDLLSTWTIKQPADSGQAPDA